MLAVRWWRRPGKPMRRQWQAAWGPMLDDPALALVLEECLALLSAGEAPAEIAGRFPDFSDSLLPLLNVAVELREGAEDAIEDPIDFLRELGQFLHDKVDGDPTT
jgi:hypothetical protein